MIPQRSPEWFAARLGCVTASRVSDVIAKTKSGWGASRATYMGQLIAERLTGRSSESFSNGAMQWGTDTEPAARAAYQFYTDLTVAEAGFVPHPTIALSGASPDGMIDDDGLLELKCPNTSTHIETLLGQSVPGKYIAQMQWQMACTGRQWCDFASFDPRMPESMSLFIQRVPRDPAMIRELEGHITVFLVELDAKVAQLSARYDVKREAA